MKFFDREKEFAFLVKVWDSVRDGKFNLIVVSGRRGVGKTRLIIEFAKEINANYLYFFVERMELRVLLARFNEVVRETFGERTPSFQSLSDMFYVIEQQAKKEPLLVIFDEFQNFTFTNGEHVYSEFQKIIDFWKFSNEPIKVLLVIIGSITGMISDLFESKQAPLYGRKTGELFLQPFKFWQIKRMLVELGVSDVDEIIKIYSILGGMPKYYDAIERLGVNLELSAVIDYMIQPEYSVWKAVKGELIEEFKEAYTTYFLILEAISNGKQTINEISNYTGVRNTSLPKYLKELEQKFNLIKRIHPTTTKPVSKRGRYKILGPFYRFWFRYIYPNMGLVEANLTGQLGKEILEDLPKHTSVVFEDIVRETLLAASNTAPEKFNLPRLTKIGCWWDKRGNEIDIVGLKGKKIVLIGEIKYKSKPAQANDIVNLIEKTKFLEQKDAKLIFISKEGFTRSAKSIIEENSIIPITLKELDEMWETIYKKSKS